MFTTLSGKFPINKLFLRDYYGDLLSQTWCPSERIVGKRKKVLTGQRSLLSHFLNKCKMLIKVTPKERHSLCTGHSNLSFSKNNYCPLSLPFEQPESSLLFLLLSRVRIGVLLKARTSFQGGLPGPGICSRDMKDEVECVSTSGV